MDIGIIGTGNVGSALADGWAASGHDVVLGSRTPDSAPQEGSRVQVRGQREAAAFGDVVVLALPAGVVTDVAAYLSNELVEKPVVDLLATDLGFDPLRAGDLDAAEHLENLARFWISLSQTYGRDVAFRLLEE